LISQKPNAIPGAQCFGDYVDVCVVIVIAEHGEAPHRRLKLPQNLSAGPGVFGSRISFFAGKRGTDEVTCQCHKIGPLSVGEFDNPVKIAAGHERVEVYVAELRDAKTFERPWKSLEADLDLADPNLMHFAKSCSKGAQRTPTQHASA
jgi:hypothetical protein